MVAAAENPGPEALEAFDRRMANEHLAGQWLVEPLVAKLVDGPLPICMPHVWKWDVVRTHLMETFDVLPEAAAARRNLSFLNPQLAKGTTPTMSAGIQLIAPGELARAHGHAMNAIRFVVEGDPELYTVVNGVKCRMEDYDLVLTPSYSLHDHHNASARYVSWLDVIDSPLYARLNQGFFVPYDGEEQPLRNVADDAGPDWLRRSSDEGERAPPLRYPWKDARAQLLDLAERTSASDLILEYVDPRTGASVLPTMACSLHLLKPGCTTPRRRDTASGVHFVIQGQGVSRIGDAELAWGQHDSFASPNWMWHSHTNLSETDAILFTISDAPAIRALGMYREEMSKTSD